MKFLELNKINKDYFTYEDIARILGITPAAAKVFAHRYVKSGILIRAKRGIYLLREKWNYFSREQKFEIANLLQVPSYISLATALDYYEITTQIQQSFIESIAIKRTKEIEINGNIFNYTRLNRDFYKGFIKQNNFFIATPEKSLLDACYLMALGRYNFDVSAIDLDKVDQDRLVREAKRFPKKNQHFMEKHGFIPEA
ncbi:MAG: type IV toxin-antitoxin system AbiEi family antitoxin domain-containing protein [bacterium]|nr:MAG: type IV toxin-antitoxin system AbiEi family antitoxin domain-containing protein [bacterium]